MERRRSRRQMFAKGRQAVSAWSEKSNDSILMKSIHISPTEHRRRLSSSGDNSLASIYSEVSGLSSESLLGMIGNDKAGGSPFGKVFDENFKAGSKPMRPTRTRSQDTPTPSFDSLDLESKHSNQMPPSPSSKRHNHLSIPHHQNTPISQQPTSNPNPHHRNAPMPQRQASEPYLSEEIPAHYRNALIPQRQESIPCLSGDSICSIDPLDKSMYLPDSSVYTFADYRFQNSSREADSSSVDSESFLDCSFTTMGAEEDSWENTTTTGDSSASAAPVGKQYLSRRHHHNKPPILEHSKSCSRIFLLDRSSSAKDIVARRAAMTKSASVQHLDSRRRELLAKSASARHMVARRKWMEETSASVRQLTVHREEQEKILNEASDDTEVDEDEDCDEFEALLQSTVNAGDKRNKDDIDENIDEDYDDDCSVFSTDSDTTRPIRNGCCNWSYNWLFSPRGKTN